MSCALSFWIMTSKYRLQHQWSTRTALEAVLCFMDLYISHRVLIFAFCFSDVNFNNFLLRVCRCVFILFLLTFSVIFPLLTSLCAGHDEGSWSRGETPGQMVRRGLLGSEAQTRCSRGKSKIKRIFPQDSKSPNELSLENSASNGQEEFCTEGLSITKFCRQEVLLCLFKIKTIWRIRCFSFDSEFHGFEMCC